MTTVDAIYMYEQEIANLIDENVQAGKMLATDADEKVMRFLQAVPEDVAKLAVSDFCGA